MGRDARFLSKRTREGGIRRNPVPNIEKRPHRDMRPIEENIETMNGNLRQVARTEPSGMRLMAFLSAHRTEILDREKNNERFIHLYGTGGYWTAFERSACQLCRLFPRSETAVFHFAARPFPVVMASVTDTELSSYTRRLALRTVDPNHKVLRVSALPSGAYERWYGDEIRELL